VISDSSNGEVARLRSRAWFDNPLNVDMTAIYLERTMNYGLTLDELQSDRPIIGIAQTGSDITPCNRHHLFLATRVRDGIRDAGGVPDPPDPVDVQAADRNARP
jgi:dihydroxy-acid dehydratase